MQFETVRYKTARFGTTKVAIASMLLLFFLSITPTLLAEDEGPKLGWADVAELSFVNTSGNSEATTISLRNTLTHQWENALFTLDFGALRAESETISGFAVGTGQDNFQLIDTSESEPTAEAYHLRGRYDRDITEKRFWYTSLGWDRNRFAGIANRYIAALGLGNTFYESDARHFRIDYAATFTSQEDFATRQTDEFAGLRFSWDYFRTLSETTTYSNLLIIDQNLDETDDLRADMVNALSVAMSERLALKLSLQLLFDNLPSFRGVPLINAQGLLTGSDVLVELDELDTILNVALVVNF